MMRGIQPNVFVGALVTGLCAVPLFLLLGDRSIELWDESRLANNALEMSLNGNWIIPYFDGSPDMWNTKPPLMIWLQAAAMKVLGQDEMAVRLPAALSALCLVCVLIVFSSRVLGDPLIGYVASGVVVSSPGFLLYHGARSGEYDAPLVLFSTIATLSYFAYLEGDPARRARFFGLTVTGLVLAVLTKGIAGLMLLPGLLLYTLVRGRLSSVLGSRELYVGILGFLVPVAAYYGGREMLNPGYLRAVLENEIGGRYLTTLEGNGAPFWFYFSNMTEYRFAPWMYVLPVALLAGTLGGHRDGRRLVSFSLMTAAVYLLIISSAGTKLWWYDLPSYPLLAMIVGVGFSAVAGSISRLIRGPKAAGYSVSLFLAIIMFSLPYGSAVARVTQVRTHPWGDQDKYHVVYRLKDLQREDPDRKTFTLLHEGYAAHLKFYAKVMNRKGYRLTVKDPGDEFEPGELVLVGGGTAKEMLTESAMFRVRDDWGTSSMVEIEKQRRKGKGGAPQITLQLEGSPSSSAETAAVLSLMPNGAAGSADWWLLARTDDGDGDRWWYRDMLAGWRAGVQPTYQGPLGNVREYVVSLKGLPPGPCTIYFGVDLLPNGTVDGKMWYEETKVRL